MAKRITDLNKLKTAIARDFAAGHGYEGRTGGWIYKITPNVPYTNPKGVTTLFEQADPVAQGWSAFWEKRRREILDYLTRKHSGFSGFQAMIDAAGGYRPTMQVENDTELLILAYEYNRAQQLRKDDRRACVPQWPAGLSPWMIGLVENPLGGVPGVG